MAFRRAAQLYEDLGPTGQSLVKTSLLYLGINLGGNIVAAATGNQDFNYLMDMAAPAASGIYLSNQLDHNINSQNARDWINVGIAGLVGWDIAGQLMNYNGNIDVISKLREIYSATNSVADKVTNGLGNFTTTAAEKGAVLGSGITGLHEFFKHRSQIRNQRNVHTAYGRARIGHH